MPKVKPPVRRTFYAAYTWQTAPGAIQRIGAGHVTVDCDTLTNEVMMLIRDKFASKVDAPPGLLVITFFAELEA